MESKWWKDKYIIGFMIVIALFLLVNIPQMNYKFSDENIYFYMGERVTQGDMPYKDFYFASPPLQVLLISLGLFLSGGMVILLKLIPIFALIGGSIFIFLMMQKKFDKLTALL